jgi:hypothetical protein
VANAIEVSDSLSNTEEQIERAAKTIGRGKRRAIFEAIYHHKSKVKTVQAIADKTNLTRMRVLQEGRHLSQKGIVRQAKKDGDTAYETIDFFQAHKKQILRFAATPEKLAKLPTKRKVTVVLPRSVTISSAGARVNRITVDDISSFGKVKKRRIAGSLPASMSEKQFKDGVQSIIGEPGEFKDWGGEKGDLYTTRLRLASKRLAAAFAFKGPGEKRKLVPGRMGKNGDQAQRLFQEEADVFLVQHWREIDSSVIELMRSLAVAKSVTTGKRIWYGVIDGADSQRICSAYPGNFSKKSRKKR